MTGLMVHTVVENLTTTATREAASEVAVAVVAGGMTVTAHLKGTEGTIGMFRLVETFAVALAVLLVEMAAIPDTTALRGKIQSVNPRPLRLFQCLPYVPTATRMSSDGTSGPLPMRTAQRLRTRPS